MIVEIDTPKLFFLTLLTIIYIIDFFAIPNLNVQTTCDVINQF